jgi:hypothetical protein
MRKRSKNSKDSKARRARRVAATRAWRQRVKRHARCFPVEADISTYNLLTRFTGLPENKFDDREAVRVALGRLLRAGLCALLEASDRRR